MATKDTKNAVNKVTQAASTTPSAAPANTKATGTVDPNVRQPNLTDGGTDTSIIGIDALTSRSVPLYDGAALARSGDPNQDRLAPTYNPGAGGGPLPRQGSKVSSTVGEERRKLYGLSADDLADLQDRLARGGFFGKADAQGKFGYTKGQLDDSTVDAYNSWLVRSAREYQRNGSTADDVLDGAIATHDADGDLKAKHGQPGGQKTMTVDLTDVHQLSQMGDTVGQAILGRALTTAEKAALTSYVHGREQARGQAVIDRQQADEDANTAAGNAADAQGGLAQSTPTQIGGQALETVDPQADTQDALREMHPGEAGANDILEGLRQVAQMMRGSQA